MAKNKFGIDQIKCPTPLWATWVFRVVFLLSTVAVGIIAAEPAIEDLVKVRILVYLQGFQALIFGLSKMVGISIKPEENQDAASEAEQV